MIVRIANTFLGVAPVPDYDHHLILSIHFRRRLPNGFPSSEEADDLTALELNLFQLLEIGNESPCVLVVTNNGLRDIIFYTRNVDGMRQKLDNSVGLFRRFEVGIAIEPDREWQIYQPFSRMRARGVPGVHSN